MDKIVCRVIGIFVLVILSIGVVSATNSSFEALTYTDEAWFFQISYPSDWIVLPHEGGSVVFFCAPEDLYTELVGEEYPRMYVFAEEVQKGTSLREYADRKSEEIVKYGVMNFTKVDSYTKTIKAGEAIVDVFNSMGRKGKTPLTTKQTVVMSDSVAYRICCQAAPGIYPEAEREYFEQMIMSFHFIGKAPENGVDKVTPTPKEEEEEVPTPGFCIISSIGILLVIAYLLRRRK